MEKMIWSWLCMTGSWFIRKNDRWRPQEADEDEQSLSALLRRRQARPFGPLAWP